MQVKHGVAYHDNTGEIELNDAATDVRTAHVGFMPGADGVIDIPRPGTIGVPIRPGAGAVQDVHGGAAAVAEAAPEDFPDGIPGVPGGTAIGRGPARVIAAEEIGVGLNVENHVCLHYCSNT